MPTKQTAERVTGWDNVATAETVWGLVTSLAMAGNESSEDGHEGHHRD
jgi:hypothetical protein